MATPAANTPVFPTGGVAVTASDTTMYQSASHVYVGTGGNVAVRPADGGAVVIFPSIPNGGVVPIMVVGVMSTSTTASGFVRLT